MKSILLASLVVLFACTDATNNGRNDQPRKKVTTSPTAESEGQLRVHFYRDKGADQLTYADLIEAISKGEVIPYRFIPKVREDNDTNVRTQISNLDNCGIETADNLDARIADCEKVNNGYHIWIGKKEGNTGEGSWSLVYFKKSDDGDTEVVWQDKTTGLLWSHNINRGTWFEASGADVASEEFICGNLDLMKEEVKWVLPSRNEFLQADLNGARFVLSGLKYQYWTSSHDYEFNSESKKAWTIIQETGVLSLEADNKKLDIRCVGIPLK